MPDPSNLTVLQAYSVTHVYNRGVSSAFIATAGVLIYSDRSGAISWCRIDPEIDWVSASGEYFSNVAQGYTK